jgi:hypothetical protein
MLSGRLTAGAILLCGLAHSIGWGIRGNWGHEYGAMIPGALSAIAACLVSGREDWRRRVVHFAYFGAMGWSFGGSMSYGLVQGYTHTGSAPDVFYGYAMLYVIGFLWGAMGGAGAGLAGMLDRKRLTDFYPPLIATFAAWFVWEYPLAAHPADWYDTDWAGVLVLLAAVLASIAIRRKITEADRLILWMAAGWWAGVLILVAGLGLRMTPPRGDNWAGCLGMVAAMVFFFARHNLRPLIWVSMLSGIVSGIGFTTGQLIRVAGFASPIRENWHSVLEQTFGFISGVGIAVGLAWLARRAPRQTEEPALRSWTEPFAFCFLLLVVTYINIVKNIHTIWLPKGVIPEIMHGIPLLWWFRFAYLAVAAEVVFLTLRHREEPLAVVPQTWLGRGQALFLLFLWWIVVGNLSRYLPFDPRRLITEGVIHVNACLASVLVLVAPRAEDRQPEEGRFPRLRGLCAASLALALLYAAVSVWGIGGPSNGARYRFGPKAQDAR